MRVQRVDNPTSDDADGVVTGTCTNKDDVSRDLEVSVWTFEYDTLVRARRTLEDVEPGESADFAFRSLPMSSLGTSGAAWHEVFCTDVSSNIATDYGISGLNRDPFPADRVKISNVAAGTATFSNPHGRYWRMCGQIDGTPYALGPARSVTVRTSAEELEYSFNACGRPAEAMGSGSVVLGRLDINAKFSTKGCNDKGRPWCKLKMRVDNSRSTGTAVIRFKLWEKGIGQISNYTFRVPAGEVKERRRGTPAGGIRALMSVDGGKVLDRIRFVNRD